VVERYPTSPKVAGALLKSGYIYYEKKDWQKARELFVRVKTDYPGTTEARLADKRLQLMDKEGN
jgi:TolA-binding protein